MAIYGPQPTRGGGGGLGKILALWNMFRQGGDVDQSRFAFDEAKRRAEQDKQLFPLTLQSSQQSLAEGAQRLAHNAQVDPLKLQEAQLALSEAQRKAALAPEQDQLALEASKLNVAGAKRKQAKEQQELGASRVFSERLPQLPGIFGLQDVGSATNRVAGEVQRTPFAQLSPEAQTALVQQFPALSPVDIALARDKVVGALTGDRGLTVDAVSGDTPSFLNEAGREDQRLKQLVQQMSALKGPQRSDYERRATFMGVPMRHSYDALRTLEQKYDPTTFSALLNSKLPDSARFLASDDWKTYDSLARAFTQNALYLFSGAAAPASEVETNKKIYFPIPGDPPSEIARKAQLRYELMGSMSGLLGNTLQPEPPGPTIGSPTKSVPGAIPTTAPSAGLFKTQEQAQAALAQAGATNGTKYFVLTPDGRKQEHVFGASNATNASASPLPPVPVPPKSVQPVAPQQPPTPPNVAQQPLPPLHNDPLALYLGLVKGLANAAMSPIAAAGNAIGNAVQPLRRDYVDPASRQAQLNTLIEALAKTMPLDAAKAEAMRRMAVLPPLNTTLQPQP